MSKTKTTVYKFVKKGDKETIPGATIKTTKFKLVPKSIKQGPRKTPGSRYA